MVALTQGSLDKIEELFKDQGYRVRYEKGTFKTGACLLQSSHVVVVNKFSNLEMKIQSLIGILNDVDIDEALISDKHHAIYTQIAKLKSKR
ncbi:hypothetical protein ACFX5U_05615 [Sphingobacterium sp. SG20118]|uniref:hypothetical protein n=1 Tax=Sphingobacterium TaxID=28453 RepID=UPI0004F767CA|nr:MULTISPECIES: hypothetical protein [Sphingobacterium]AIM36464.1 hypothetical protein KO02_06930 [Sphingobacterium sp. ML3W]MDH5827397.1 hypothetical protein [Sphingobacterium faecium]